MSRSVQDQILKDRSERIRKREELKRIQSYHKEILQKGRLPPISDSDSDGFKTFTMGSEPYHGSVRSLSRMSLDSGTQRPETTSSGADTHDFFKMRRDVLAKALASSSQSEAAESSILKGNLKRENFRRAMSSSPYSVPHELLPRGSVATSASTVHNSQLSCKSMPAITANNSGIMSMSRPLGSKPAAFGAVKKKKKKKKGKKGKQ